MSELTLGQLIDIVRQYGEQDEDVRIEITEECRGKSLRDLGFDSLGIFNVTVQVSGMFQLDLPYDDVATADTLDVLLAVINKKFAEK